MDWEEVTIRDVKISECDTPLAWWMSGILDYLSRQAVDGMISEEMVRKELDDIVLKIRGLELNQIDAMSRLLSVNELKRVLEGRLDQLAETINVLRPYQLEEPIQPDATEVAVQSRKPDASTSKDDW